MKEEWLEQLKNILRDMEESEDCELELVIENLSTGIDELENIV